MVGLGHLAPSLSGLLLSGKHSQTILMPPQLSGELFSLDLDGDLTAKPTQRVLFPSPRSKLDTKDSPSTRSKRPAENLTDENLFDDIIHNDKENCPPVDADDDIDRLFNGNSSVLQQRTPTGAVRSALETLKTPDANASPRANLTPKSDSVIATKNNTLDPTTPCRKSRQDDPIVSMTPFTAELHQLLSEGIDMHSPSRLYLVTQETSFHGVETQAEAAEVPGVDAVDLLGTDLTIPSSPCNLFSLYEDPQESIEHTWCESSAFSSPAKDLLPDGKRLAVDESSR
jgi:hypothetical protein